MRDWAAQKRRVEEAWQLDVVGESPRAAQQAIVFDTRDRATDPAKARSPVFIDVAQNRSRMRRSRRFRAVEQPAKALTRLARDFGAWRVRGRKVVAPVKGAARIDDRDRMRHVARGALLGRQTWIGRRIPGAGNELNRFLGIGTGEHGPEQ